MMLTAKGRYAVMAMVDIAVRGERDKPTTLADIAVRQGITVPYLEQIFAKLKASGLVKSVRGPGGGYLLAKAPGAINVAEIILATNEDIKVTRCDHHPEGGCLSKNTRCLTHDLWDGMGNHIYAYLKNTSLEDVCERRVNVFPEGHGPGMTLIDALQEQEAVR